MKKRRRRGREFLLWKQARQLAQFVEQVARDGAALAEVERTVLESGRRGRSLANT